MPKAIDLQPGDRFRRTSEEWRTVISIRDLDNVANPQRVTRNKLELTCQGGKQLWIYKDDTVTIDRPETQTSNNN